MSTDKELQEITELSKFKKEFDAYFAARKNNFMITARQEGKTLSQIAKATGMLETNVSRALKEKHFKLKEVPERPEIPSVLGPYSHYAGLSTEQINDMTQLPEEIQDMFGDN